MAAKLGRFYLMSIDAGLFVLSMLIGHWKLAGYPLDGVCSNLIQNSIPKPIDTQNESMAYVSVHVLYRDNNKLLNPHLHRKRIEY